MQTLVFDKRNISLDYENNCLIIRQPHQPPRTFPLTQIRKILCLHSVTLSTSLLGQLWQRGIDFITLNNRYSERSFALYPNQQRQVERRCLQYHWQQHEPSCLSLARQLCQHRLLCNIRLLSIDTLLIETLHNCHQQMRNCQSLSELRGLEGSGQRQVFEHWRQQLAPNLGFRKRIRRPPPDPVNALLSLTYTIVMQEAIRQCTSAGLDSQLGFYHRTAFGRHSLACDVMEPVRPHCEAWVFQQFIDGNLNQKHFSGNGSGDNPCLLGKHGRELYYQNISTALPQWQRQLKATTRWISRNIDTSLVKQIHHDN